jgi:hypothetical protein
MGIRSQVGFCVAPGIEVPRFEDIETDWKFDKIVRDERGTFYFVDEIKWGTGDGTPRDVENFLRSLNPEDCFLIEMYPGDGLGMEIETIGERWDNEFDLGYISRLTYDGEKV